MTLHSGKETWIKYEWQEQYLTVGRILALLICHINVQQPEKQTQDFYG